jgi:hypothetical protein
MRRRSLLKAGAQTVVENIDELAFLLTGYRKFITSSRTRPRGRARLRRRQTMASRVDRETAAKSRID